MTDMAQEADLVLSSIHMPRTVPRGPATTWPSAINGKALSVGADAKTEVIGDVEWTGSVL